MKTQFIAVSTALLAGLFLPGCGTSSGVVSTGADTFMIARTGHGSEGTVKATAMAEAAALCQRQGKVLQVIESSGRDGIPTLTDSKAEIHFRCLDPNDPRLTQAPAATGLPPVQSPPPPAPADSRATPPPPVRAPGDDLYTQLTKLNELREQGILSEAEFQAQKARVLAEAR